MNKFLKALLACTLALVMVFALVSCDSSDKDDDDDDKKKSSVDFDEIVNTLTEYSQDNEDECEFVDLDDTIGNKHLVAGFEECGEIKGDLEAAYEFSNIEDDDETAWCVIVEFEKASDAKTVAKEIEDKMEDFFISMMVSASKAMLGDEYEDMMDEMEDMMMEEFKGEAEAMIPSKISVERKGNIVFFGDKKTVESVLEIIEDAK